VGRLCHSKCALLSTPFVWLKGKQVMDENNVTAEQTLLPELSERFSRLQGAYEEVDARIDSLIVRWRYAVHSVFELQADYHRRFNEKRGVLVDTEPSDEFMFHAYGYDAQDRVIYDAFFQTEMVPRLARYYEYDDGGVHLAEFALIYFTENYYLRGVGRLVQPAGAKPQRYALHEAGTGEMIQYYEAYDYDPEGRLVHIYQHTLSHPTHPTASARDSYWDTIYNYDGDHLKRIYTLTPDGERLDYEAPRPGETYESLFEAARVSLRSQVEAYFQQLPSHEPVYLLILSFDAATDDGIGLVLGWEKQREAWTRQSADYTYRDLIYDLMSQLEPETQFVPLPEPLSVEYQRFIRDMRRDENWDAIRELMIRVAQDLNQVDWRGRLETTPDFIVVASDYEAMTDPHDDVRASVPEEKLKPLQLKGLLDHA